MLGSDEVKDDEQPKVANMETLLNTFISEIRKMGITKIEGKIIGDDSYFNSTELQPVTWQWNDLGNYYGAGPSALNFHENLYYLYFNRTNSIGSLTSVNKITPKIPYLTFQNEVRIGAKGSGDDAYIFGAPNTYDRYIRGTIPPGTSNFKIKGSVPNPAYFAAYSLMETLENNGIKTKKVATTELERIREGEKSTTARTVIYTHQSPMIKEIIARANEKSNNLYCEALLKAMGKK